MRRTTEILKTLKKYLKAKGVTYRQIAVELGVSETTIKRVFSEETFTLARLEDICRIVDLDLYDLTLMAKRQNHPAETVLNLAQEEALAADPKLVAFFYFLINGWPLSFIRTAYDFSENDITRRLLELDRLELIELHPENRFRLLVSKNVFWRKGGPLWNMYQNEVMNDFLDHPFNLPNDRLVFSPGVLSDASLKIILKKIDDLTRQFNDLAEMDATLPLKGRFSTGLVIGFRPWVFSMIADLRRRTSRSDAE